MNQLLEQVLAIVEKLNEQELHRVHQAIAERLNLFHKVNTLYAMKDFHLLDRVSFTHNGTLYKGTVTRLNQKTITVTLDSGTKWTVHPSFLKKVSQEKETQGIQKIKYHAKR